MWVFYNLHIVTAKFLYLISCAVQLCYFALLLKIINKKLICLAVKSRDALHYLEMRGGKNNVFLNKTIVFLFFYVFMVFLGFHTESQK